MILPEHPDDTEKRLVAMGVDFDPIWAEEMREDIRDRFFEQNEMIILTREQHIEIEYQVLKEWARLHPPETPIEFDFAEYWRLRPYKEVRLRQGEIKWDKDKSPPDHQRDKDWVYANLENKQVHPKEAPSRAAWGQLLSARQDKSKFYANYKAKNETVEEDADVRAERKHVEEIRAMIELAVGESRE